MTETDTAPRLVLMAAGRSSRYGRPKPVEPLGPGGASLMAYTVFDALRVGFGGVVIVTSPDLRAPLEAHLLDHLGPGLPLTWVYQEMEAIPEAHRSLAAERRKPWGTGHAVWVARDQLPGPFGVANADDGYGPEALQSLADALRRMPAASSPPCPAVLVGFPLDATLPPGGAGVSRGWVKGRDGEVEEVLELREVKRSAPMSAPGPGGAAVPETSNPLEVTGIDPDGDRVRVPDDAWVSMNLWGLPACILSGLAAAFDDFLERDGSRPGAEFALSSALDSLIQRGDATLTLLPQGRRWFGITHPGDAAWVRERLQRLHADGTYPPRLSGPPGGGTRRAE